MRHLAQRYPFATFYGLAVAIVAGVVGLRIGTGLDYLTPLFGFLQQKGLYANTISIAWFAASTPIAFSIFVFAGAPTIAAIVTAALRGGDVLKRLFSTFRPWLNVPTRQGIRAYQQLAAIYLGGVIFYVGGSLLLVDGSIDTLLAGVGGTLASAAFWLLIGPFVDEGGLWEELGWRGYALPLLLQRRTSPLRATLLLGFLWWAWHFPREIPNLLAGVDLLQWAYGQSLFILTCLSLSVVITYFWARTGGSMWPGLLVHGFTNVWSKALSGPLYSVISIDLRTLLVTVLATYLLLRHGPRLGWEAAQEREVSD